METINEQSEYIFRVKGVTPEMREAVEALLARAAKPLGAHASLTRIDRDERGSHAMHLRRKRII